LLAFRFAAPLVQYRWEHRHAGAILFALLLVWHLVPFVQATQRHVDFTNARQQLLMRTAEAMTDARADRVYDATGLVLTRQSIGYYWYTHSLNQAAFASGAIPSVASMLSAHPPAVIIRSYRTDMVADAGKQLMEQRYLALSDDFWVLGSMLAPGGGRYRVLHPGRYAVLRAAGPRLLPLATAAFIDGKALPAEPVALAPGAYRIDTAPGVRAAVVWVGPTLNAPPELARVSRQRLFRNFY
jgi:hypothetical protein